MRKKRFVSIVMLIVFAVTFLAEPLTVWGTWTDDWFNQKVSQSPSYTEGQKRGYFQGGSFNARWRQSSDSLVTVNPPSLKLGCGGIDLFTGGISFMDFEYLVQKLQRILQSAPGYAFQIGLKVLCEKCSSALEWITGISDGLNGLQLDDCKAGKALVAYAAKDLASDTKAAGDIASALADFKQSSGAETLYKKINEGFASNDNKTTSEKPSFDEMVSGCSAELQSIFLTEGSLLDNAGARINFSPAHIALVRGLMGDIKITRTNGPIQAQWVAPCEENGDNPFGALASGTVFVRSSIDDQACSAETDINGALAKRIGDLMQGIANSMKNKTALTAEQATFVDTNPLSVQLVLKTAVGTSQETATIGILADVTTKQYTYMLLSDLYARVSRVISELKRAKDTGSLGAAHNCDLSIANAVFEKASDLPSLLKLMAERSYQEASRAASEVVMIYNLAEHHRKFDELANKELKRKFGGAVTMRAMSR